MDNLRKLGFVAAMAGVLGATSSFAGQNYYQYRDHARHFGRHHLTIVSGSITPVPVPGIGTFVGDLSVSDIRGTGLFVTFAPNTIAVNERAAVIAPKAKIIYVTDKSEKSACSMEQGVCVIRAQ